MISKTTVRRDDDFRYSIFPRWFDEFWDFPRNTSLTRLTQLSQANKLPHVSIFVGPPGSGKNAAAYILAMTASCNHSHPQTHAPCGKCQSCVYIQLGRDSWLRAGFFEIECASRRSSDAATADIYDAYGYLVKGDRLAYANSGDPARDAVVLLDEAHRLPLATRAALLTLMPRWKRAHLILATTNIRELQVEPHRRAQDDTLVSRASIFRFNYPLNCEAVNGLQMAASRVNMELTREAAEWVVARNERQPRKCLGDLYLLSSLKGQISREMAKDMLGDMDEEPKNETAPNDDPDAPQPF